MNALSANEAKTHFGDMLLKAQRAPVQMSAEDYQNIEAMKLRLLQASQGRYRCG